MIKARASKLDGFAERLEEWFLAGKTLAEAQEQLKLDGCQVSLGRLSEWWAERRRERAEAELLQQIATGAKQVRDVEAEFALNPAPALKTIMGLHRVLILKLSTEGAADPEKLELVNRMMREAQKFARLEQLGEALKLETKKFQRETCELFLKWAEDERARAVAAGAGSNAEKIERLGQMMFGEEWNGGVRSAECGVRNVDNS